MELPSVIYKNDPHWIKPLNKDIDFVFDTHKNRFFKLGELCRWILKDEDEHVIGRIAAFIDKKTAHGFEQLKMAWIL